MSARDCVQEWRHDHRSRQLPCAPEEGKAVEVQALYCFPDDQLPHLPDGRTAPDTLPPGTPLPRVGDLVYVSSTSAWAVIAVVHEWLTPTDLRIEVWLEYVGHARTRRPAECKLTH